VTANPDLKQLQASDFKSGSYVQSLTKFTKSQTEAKPLAFTF
jgi:hypothetical protein